MLYHKQQIDLNVRTFRNEKKKTCYFCFIRLHTYLGISNNDNIINIYIYIENIDCHCKYRNIYSHIYIYSRIFHLQKMVSITEVEKMGLGHFGRGHLGRGHYGRGHLGRGHYGRGHFGRGHLGRGHFGPLI